MSKKLKINTKSDIKPFTIAVQLYIIETSQIEDNSENLGSTNENFTDNVASNRELHAYFQLKSNDNGDKVSSADTTIFRDLLHFLLTFLTKYLPLTLKNKNSTTININKNFNNDKNVLMEDL